MGKLYFKKSSKEEKFNHEPKKETIDFLLNYSKALNVVEYRKMKFESLMN